MLCFGKGCKGEGGNIEKFLFHQIKTKFEIIKPEMGRRFQNIVISFMQSVGCYQ